MSLISHGHLTSIVLEVVYLPRAHPRPSSSQTRGAGPQSHRTRRADRRLDLRPSLVDPPRGCARSVGSCGPAAESHWSLNPVAQAPQQRHRPRPPTGWPPNSAKQASRTSASRRSTSTHRRCASSPPEPIATDPPPRRRPAARPHHDTCFVSPVRCRATAHGRTRCARGLEGRRALTAFRRRSWSAAEDEGAHVSQAGQRRQATRVWRIRGKPAIASDRRAHR